MTIPSSSGVPRFLLEPSFASIKQALPVVTTASLVLISFLIFFAVWAPKSEYPLANAPTWFETTGSKRKKFMKDGVKIFNDALKRYGKKPFKLITNSGVTTVFPPEYANIMRSERHLVFGKAVAHDFGAQIPGLEPFLVLDHPRRVVQVVAKKQLTKQLKWNEANIKEQMLAMVSRLSSRVFLGEELCRNEAWLRASGNYTVSSFKYGQATSVLPASLRIIKSWFSKDMKLIRQYFNEANDILAPILEKRKQAKLEAEKKGEPAPIYNDMLEWLEKEGETTVDALVGCQMLLTMAAIHTTSELMTQAMTHFAMNPHLVADLRKEIIELMDSALKETQRLSPINYLTMRRVTAQDVTLSDGTVIKKGEYTTVNAKNMANPQIWSEPDKYDMYRYYRMRQDPAVANKVHLVTTSPDHMGFGHGDQACPGRFFVAHECDWELASDANPELIPAFGENISFDPANKVRFRRCREEVDLESLVFK
ncbi:hypothetical protein COCCADRAFT_33839 [Bipolaris zeicola 26-R-13]|uniref:Cytochrome P450 monooxygenase n=1 Tax=Cochliobolus carbonum (strain 26-R-13) TaxID=930089 RepID=W6YZI2_COCC2|nr:uncharacterized protein COCCADRAFT_33839 [Bipolaris zeicola 26-R-13]EUC36836.1 hypothetical protein COCCADRAFT_33839 [Bipolaris zeicola 26-R-13]